MSRDEQSISPDAYAIVLGLRLIANEIALLRREMNARPVQDRPVDYQAAIDACAHDEEGS